MAGTPLMRIETPLGKDLLFSSMRGTVELGRIPRYDVTLLSRLADIDLPKLLGKRARVVLQLAGSGERNFSGYVVRFQQTGIRGRYHVYQACIRPWLWLLTRRANCRIFQRKTVEQIVKTILADSAYANLELGEIVWKLNYRKHPERDYCVQYRETDFNFVSRLLEDEGIYFWFQRKGDKERLVFTDDAASHAAAQGCERLPFGQTRDDAPDTECIADWNTHFEIQTASWALTDYDFEHPSRPLQKKARRELAGLEGFDALEQFDYPGGYVDPSHGESRVRTRADESLDGDEQLGWNRIEATTNARALEVGAVLQVERRPRKDQNTGYLITAASYALDYADYEGLTDAQPTSYLCRFTAIDARQPFAPARATRKPFVHGPQTGVVVGPKGEEIYTDKYGRVKVQFFWDREGRSDENSSCWVRVSHPWAGKNWGGISIPRIGQEVVIDFLEGDPDRPIITGRVYNAEQMPPFGLPGAATVSGIKSNTHKGRGYNELAMDDTAGKEQVRIHGQHDMDTVVEHDQSTTVHNRRTDVIDDDDSESVGKNQKQTVKIDQTVGIGANQSLKVGANQNVMVGAIQAIAVIGNRIRTVGGNENITVTGNRTRHTLAAESVTIGATLTTHVKSSSTLNVDSALTESIGADASETVQGAKSVTVKGGMTVSVAADRSVTVEGSLSESVGANHQETVKADYALQAKNVSITADTITLTAGDSTIVMDKSGIQMKASAISTTSSGHTDIKADGKVNIKGTTVNAN